MFSARVLVAQLALIGDYAHEGPLGVAPGNGIHAVFDTILYEVRRGWEATRGVIQSGVS